MREYEVTIVIQPELNDESREEIIDRVKAWLTPEDGDGPVLNHWGARQLAYPLKGFKQGYYVFFEATLDPGRVAQIERDILYQDDIIRHLVVRKDD